MAVLFYCPVKCDALLLFLIQCFCESGGDKTNCFYASFTHLMGEQCKGAANCNLHEVQQQEFPNAHAWSMLKSWHLLMKPLSSPFLIVSNYNLQQRLTSWTPGSFMLSRGFHCKSKNTWLRVYAWPCKRLFAVSAEVRKTTSERKDSYQGLERETRGCANCGAVCLWPSR